MKLIIKSLRLENFKGIQQKEIEFDDHETFLAARNGGGKTTLSDAYHWLLTGKDSTDTVKFQIKPIINGKQLEKVDNIVEAHFILDGNPLVLKKVHSEKWKRPRGQATSVFDGNETSYHWNHDVVTETIYLQRLSEIVDLNKLKLFSNSGYFNSLSKQERRAILVDMAGTNNVESLIASSPNYAFIGEFLNQKLTFKEKKAAIANNKKRTKDELSGIPARIDELTRSNALLERPFGRLDEGLKSKEAELSGIEKSINDKNEAHKEEDIKIELLRKKKRDFENEAILIEQSLKISISANVNAPDETKLQFQQEIKKDQYALKSISEEIEQFKTRISNGQKTIDALVKDQSEVQKKIDELGAQWDDVNESALKFKEGEFTCQTCHRDYDKSDIVSKKHEMIANFNKNKITTLSDIESKAADLIKNILPKIKADIAKYTEALDSISFEVNKKELDKSEALMHLEGCELSLKNYKPAQAEISAEDQLNDMLSKNADYHSFVKYATAVQVEMDTIKPIDNSVLITRKKELTAEIDELKKELLNKDTIASNTRRITELKEEESNLNNSLAILESQEYHINQFVFKQMEEVGKKVNSLFSFVQFQMFDTQVDGEIVDDCITMVDGRPVQKNAVNTADEVNAGVDIINTISKHYNVYLPMWVDKRESVTKLLPSVTQIINLSVNPEYDTVTKIK